MALVDGVAIAGTTPAAHQLAPSPVWWKGNANANAPGLRAIRRRPRVYTPGAICLPPRRYLKLKRDEAAEKQDEETVDVTPIMICVFVVMCCSMLVLLYFFYDYLGRTDALARR